MADEKDQTVGDVLATFVQRADPEMAADLRAAARAASETDRTPLDHIRGAERLIRERATIATSGPWEFRPRRGFESMGHQPATIGFLDTAGYFVMLREGTWATEGDMAYIASWHPAVAVAVADMLHQAAMDLWAYGPLCECGTGCDACDDNLWEPHARAALALADLIIPPAAGADQ